MRDSISITPLLNHLHLEKGVTVNGFCGNTTSGHHIIKPKVGGNPCDKKVDRKKPTMVGGDTHLYVLAVSGELHTNIGP